MGAGGAERRYSDSMPGEQGTNLQGNLSALWTENRAMVLKRMDLLEREFWNWLKTPGNRTASIIARDLAHKMAGVLGTFGMKRGSMIASTLERIASMPQNGGRYGSSTVYALLNELREIVRAKS
jgi:hypothetical protein